MTRLIRAELLKIRTTNTWWIFLICAFLATAAALAIWLLVANDAIETARSAVGEGFVPSEDAPPGLVEEERRQWELQHDIKRTLVSSATQIYTSGQFFGLMFAMLLGALLMTNEFYHQTATATFLTTPRRTAVIVGKLVTAMLAAAFFWVFSTALSLAAGAIFYSAKGYGSQLGEWPVTRAILLNALAYGLWGVLGVALGVLIRSQIGAVVTGTVAYVIGTFLLSNIVVPILVFGLNQQWALDAAIAWPGIASVVMVSTEPPFAGMPPWWAGALVLVGYGLAFGAVGTMITRRRDVS
jgi:ABC-type transport system involved in multi-copper enzyme maturation permease subunit